MLQLPVENAVVEFAGEGGAVAVAYSSCIDSEYKVITGRIFYMTKLSFY